MGGRPGNRQGPDAATPELFRWIYEGSSLIELGRHDEAHKALSGAARRFPKDEVIAYDLACVCCVLKRTDEARTWLATAIELGGESVKLTALDDPDLEDIWRGTSGS